MPDDPLRGVARDLGTGVLSLWIGSGVSGAELLIAALEAALGITLLTGGDVYAASLVYSGLSAVVRQGVLGWVAVAGSILSAYGALRPAPRLRAFSLLTQLAFWLFLLVLFAKSPVPSAWPSFCSVLSGSCVLLLAQLAWQRPSTFPFVELRLTFRRSEKR